MLKLYYNNLLIYLYLTMNITSRPTTTSETTYKRFLSYLDSSGRLLSPYKDEIVRRLSRMLLLVVWWSSLFITDIAKHLNFVDDKQNEYLFIMNDAWLIYCLLGLYNCKSLFCIYPNTFAHTNACVTIET